jgi:hypothetical protein
MQGIYSTNEEVSEGVWDNVEVVGKFMQMQVRYSKCIDKRREGVRHPLRLI